MSHLPHHIAAIFLLLALLPLNTEAESFFPPLKGDSADRSVRSVYAIEWGSASIVDTYLSPLRYSGSRIALSGFWEKNLSRRPDRWSMAFDASIAGDRTLNPAGNTRMFAADARFDWGMSLRHSFPCRLTLAAGTSAGINAGIVYLPRNGNNPASVKADMRISLTASASWRCRLGKLPVVVRDAVRLPSLSVFFSPQFGETYYEIYLGNRHGLAHCGWWGNHFDIDNLLSADLGLGRTALRLGYRFEARTSMVCHINTRIFSHSLVIGVIPGGISAPKPCKMP